MKEYLILIREPDGRTKPHTPEEFQQHQENWQRWLTRMKSENKLLGGKPLTLEGNVIRNARHGLEISNKLYVVNGTEIVGGYLLLQANNIHEATDLMTTCPVFESDGFVEIREVM